MKRQNDFACSIISEKRVCVCVFFCYYRIYFFIYYFVIIEFFLRCVIFYYIFFSMHGTTTANLKQQFEIVTPELKH